MKLSLCFGLVLPELCNYVRPTEPKTAENSGFLSQPGRCPAPFLWTRQRRIVFPRRRKLTRLSDGFRRLTGGDSSLGTPTFG